MIESQVAGILFTANPINQARTQAVLNASWGLGEAIVSGLVTPDTWVIDKANGAILEVDIAPKGARDRICGDGRRDTAGGCSTCSGQCALPG